MATPYSGAASHVRKEAETHHDEFSHGGRKHIGKAHGGHAKHRADKRARGGKIEHSPFSSAAKMQDEKRTPKTKDHAQPRKHGGRSNPVKAKHERNFGAHHGAGHEEGLEHHLPIHHKHGGKEMHLGRKEGGKCDKDMDGDGD